MLRKKDFSLQKKLVQVGSQIHYTTDVEKQRELKQKTPRVIDIPFGLGMYRNRLNRDKAFNSFSRLQEVTVKIYQTYDINLTAILSYYYLTLEFCTNNFFLSFFTSSGAGVEAFFSTTGHLIVAVCNKKEYTTVTVPVCQLCDRKWVCSILNMSVKFQICMVMTLFSSWHKAIHAR